MPLTLRTLTPLLLASLLLLSPALAQEDGLAEVPPVRVGLAEGLRSASCGVTGGAGQMLRLPDLEPARTLSDGATLDFSAADSSVKGPEGKAEGWRIVPSTSEGRVTYAGKPYRGAIEIHIWEGALIVVNHCSLDEYLYGVVPTEMPNSWHMEALMAQAVAARTYAVKRIGQYEHGYYDLKPTVWDQVYGGANAEKSRCSEAIDATSGLILTYNDQPIEAFFHSASGESTVNGSAMRGDHTRLPYLVGVPSREPGVQRWVVAVSAAELRRKLKGRGYTCGAIIDLFENPLDPGLITIDHEEGTLDLPRNYLRSFLGSDKFRSANFKIELSEHAHEDRKPLPDGCTITFLGTGWGHGVGMSQWGAKGYADEGWDYKRILTHFYHGATLSVWYDFSE